MKLKVEKVTQSMRRFTLLVTSSEASAISTALWKTTLKACNPKIIDCISVGNTDWPFTAWDLKQKDKPSFATEPLWV